MHDPELVFEVDAAGQFHPVSFQQDNLGIYHEAVFVDDAGRVMVRPPSEGSYRVREGLGQEPEGAGVCRRGAGRARRRATLG